VVTLEVLQTGDSVPEGRWLRIGEVAERLGVSVSTARNYFDAGVFRAQKTRRLRHGDRRVQEDEVDRYLRELEAGQQPATDR
jgi:excisionase family DNA binding protein